MRSLYGRQDSHIQWWTRYALATCCQSTIIILGQTGRTWTDLGEGRGLAPASAAPSAPRPDQYDYDSAASSSVSSFASGSSLDNEDSSVSLPRPGNLRGTSSTSLSESDVPQQPPQKAGKQKEKGDTWIYCFDANLYCGIKQKGRFQHSSFLAGGPITSAGTMVIKDGVLLKCNPMSGHYRTKADYFKRFISELEDQGADLSNVKIGKTELKLWFIERANTLHSLKGKTRRLEKQMEKQLHLGK